LFVDSEPHYAVVEPELTYKLTTGHARIVAHIVRARINNVTTCCDVCRDALLSFARCVRSTCDIADADHLMQ